MGRVVNAAWQFTLEYDEGVWSLTVDADDDLHRFHVTDPAQLLRAVSGVQHMLDERSEARSEWLRARRYSTVEESAEAYAEDWPRLWGLDDGKWAA